MTIQNLKADRSLARMNFAADPSEINKATLDKAEKAVKDFKAGVVDTGEEPAEKKKPGAPKKPKPADSAGSAPAPDDPVASAAAEAATSAADSALQAEEAAEEAKKN